MRHEVVAQPTHAIRLAGLMFTHWRRPMSGKMKLGRRHFLATAVITIVTAQFGVAGAAQAQSLQPEAAQVSATPSATPDVFGPLKHIDAGVLNVAYAELGPADGPVVILLHGWPYDIHSYEEVAPLLAAKGYRVLVPYVRGYGDTRFLSPDTPRNAQPAALASDVIDVTRPEQ